VNSVVQMHDFGGMDHEYHGSYSGSRLLERLLLKVVESPPPPLGSCPVDNVRGFTNLTWVIRRMDIG